MLSSTAYSSIRSHLTAVEELRLTVMPLSRTDNYVLQPRHWPFPRHPSSKQHSYTSTALLLHQVHLDISQQQNGLYSCQSRTQLSAMALPPKQMANSPLFMPPNRVMSSIRETQQPKTGAERLFEEHTQWISSVSSVPHPMLTWGLCFSHRQPVSTSLWVHIFVCHNLQMVSVQMP